MAKDQKDFFKEKKPWSEVKDELLACYLKPYFQKVLHTRKPVRYIDCFAGRGNFDDGRLGSPLIALNTARDCITATKGTNTDIALTFIEARWATELERISAAQEQKKLPRVRFSVVNGRFERDTYMIVQGMTGQNVFLYIDPYGVRNLDHDLIKRFADPVLGLFSIELLINFNSFGFLRAGCLAMKVRYRGDAALRDDDEFSEEWSSSARSVEALNAIAGGDYWQAVVHAFKRKEIDGYKAEVSFAAQYRAKLSETYRYVLSMPIRLQDRQQPKYRMVYATNHAEGCILMADNMMTRTDNLAIHLQSHQQESLFDEGVDGEITDPSYVQGQVQVITGKLRSFTPAEEVIADFYAQEGVICKAEVIRKALRQMEKDGTLTVKRDPSHTPTGKPSTFFTTARGQEVVVRAAGRPRKAATGRAAHELASGSLTNAP